jgi:hypothetical protein
MTSRRTALGRLAALVASLAGAGRARSTEATQNPADAREVRQIVTFRFLPGQTSAVLDIYATQLIPIYREVESMRTVRLFMEAESPEPLDLMVVTHYDSMAGMDRANDALRRPSADRPPIGQIYRQIADLSLGHTDQFVELVSPPNAPAPTEPQLEVLEFLRVSAGTGTMFERGVTPQLHAWEQESPVRDILLRSETARFLVADGWDYLRTYAVRNLGAWQAYATARARHGVWLGATRTIELRKTLILRELTELRVR